MSALVRPDTSNEALCVSGHGTSFSNETKRLARLRDWTCLGHLAVAVLNL